MQSFTVITVACLMSSALVFDRLRWRRRIERFGSVTGLCLVPLKNDEAAAHLLSLRDRANRLYAVGEYGAAAELLMKSR